MFVRKSEGDSFFVFFNAWVGVWDRDGRLHVMLFFINFVPMNIIELNWEGLAVGICTFLIIGLFHPLVIKGEYYFGRKVNWGFAVLGVVTAVMALLCSSLFVSSLLAVVSFSSFWSIKEVIEQEERVRKGWFPANPKRARAKREE